MLALPVLSFEFRLSSRPYMVAKDGMRNYAIEEFNTVDGLYKASVNGNRLIVSDMVGCMAACEKDASAVHIVEAFNVNHTLPDCEYTLVPGLQFRDGDGEFATVWFKRFDVLGSPQHYRLASVREYLNETAETGRVYIYSLELHTLKDTRESCWYLRHAVCRV